MLLISSDGLCIRSGARAMGMTWTPGNWIQNSVPEWIFLGVAFVMFSRGSMPLPQANFWCGGTCNKEAGWQERGAEEGCVCSTPWMPHLQAHWHWWESFSRGEPGEERVSKTFMITPPYSSGVAPLSQYRVRQAQALNFLKKHFKNTFLIIPFFSD